MHLHLATVLIVASLFTTSAFADTWPKLPIPEDAAQKEARQLISNLYKDQFAAATTPEKRIAFAKKLLQVGLESKNDATGRFALFQTARDIAADAGDVATAMNAIGLLADHYEVDALAMRANVLARVAKALRVPKKHQELASTLDKAVHEAIDQDRFDVAKSINTTALDSARLARSGELVKQVVAKGKEIEDLADQYQKVETAFATLENSPIDPESNLVVGSYQCFAKGNWENGLLMLALGSDKKLRTLAIAEIAEERDALAIGNSWWEFSDTVEGSLQSVARERATRWYKQAMPGLDGLSKKLVESRLDSVAPPSNTTIPSETAATKRQGGSAKSPALEKGVPKRPSIVPDGSVYWKGRWYWFPDGRVSFKEAADSAIKMKGRLLTIATMEENDFVAGHVRGPTFLGLRKIMGRWLNIDGIQQQFFNWDNGQPSSVPGETCVAIHKGGRWHDYFEDRLFFAVVWSKD